MVSNWTYDPRDSRGGDNTKGEYGVFTVTNAFGTTGLSLDCNGEAGALLVADTLAALIKILIEKGIIGGTVA